MALDKGVQRNTRYLTLSVEFNQIRAFSCGVFIDLKKALDTVDHSIFLHKLDFYGFRGITNVWFRSYLQNRTQVTVINHRLRLMKLSIRTGPKLWKQA